MRIFLIGNSGQLGKELHKRILDRGHDLVSFSHQELDITDSDKVLEQMEQYRPEVVINSTAYHVVSECEDNPSTAFENNAFALLKIAKYCNENDIRFVTFSSDYVFDGLKGQSYEENDKPNPLQIYGISKLAGEFIVLNYCRKAMVIRTCGVYGGKEGSRSKKGNFVINIRRQAEGKETLEISSEQVVSPTYAVDLADATIKLLDIGEENGIFHLVNEGSCSWAEFAEEIMKVEGLKTKIIPVDRRGFDGSVKKPLRSALKNVRAKKLGIVLPSWQDAVKRYLISINQ